MQSLETLLILKRLWKFKDLYMYIYIYVACMFVMETTSSSCPPGTFFSFVNFDNVCTHVYEEIIIVIIYYNYNKLYSCILYILYII